jgi:hypothetical protein
MNKDIELIMAALLNIIRFGALVYGGTMVANNQSLFWLGVILGIMLGSYTEMARTHYFNK